ncbi:sugar transferase [Variovorax sp. J22G21]|uniref:sugar transferase n=1 Tax=Variovorax fucosicus TaxID=3053517 RepID=UPI00257619C0|nr:MULTISPECIES: sugar transferase [unclassified Variovorax]MDM0039471.1 sugar transferase [Variovorax sp. J22R193]MDM0064246.1 sugar transferase [Variovorax sp. J22G21]
MPKRAFDFVFSIFALVLVLPLLVVLSAWIKLDSPGPIFFRQVRVGLHGRTFRIFKLRTMRTASGAPAPQVTVGADPRITAAGRLLRAYKLDELPQFFNVLIGEMSVVGPRPEVPRYVAIYPPDIKNLVLSVRPGITDAASIAYRDESALLAGSDDPERFYVETVLPAKLRYAADYVRQQSFGLDMCIIWRTVVAVFTARR